MMKHMKVHHNYVGPKMKAKEEPCFYINQIAPGAYVAKKVNQKLNENETEASPADETVAAEAEVDAVVEGI